MFYTISDVLPQGMTYVPGSTVINSIAGLYDPYVSGNRLVWECGINMPSALCPLDLVEVGMIQFDALFQ